MLIGDRYKIESDSLNVTLYKKVNVKKTGGIRWQPIAYFSNPQNALQYLVDHEVKETGMADLETVVKKMEELHRLVATLKGLPETVQPCTRPPKEKLRGKLHEEKVVAAGQGVML